MIALLMMTGDFVRGHTRPPRKAWHGIMQGCSSARAQGAASASHRRMGWESCQWFGMIEAFT